MSLLENLGRCGVYCGQCRSYTGEVVDQAFEFKELVAQDYSWLKHEDYFNYDNFIEGLDWFIKSRCPGCRNLEETWCDVWKCEKIREKLVDNCLMCDDFSTCPPTEYQRNRYSYLFDHIKFIEEEGFTEFLESEEAKATEGVRLQEIRDY